MLRPSKRHIHANNFAECLEITTEEVNSFIRCIEKGGAGAKVDNTWKSNPAPFDVKINLTNKEDNLLNIHYNDIGRKTQKSALDDSIFSEPSPSIIDESSRFIRLGRMSTQNKNITIQTQREIVKAQSHQGLKSC